VTASRTALAVAAIVLLAVAWSIGHRASPPPRAPEPVAAASPRQRAVVPVVQSSSRPPAAAPREIDDPVVAQPAPPPRQMSHREARQLVEHVVETRLERKLTANDYDRLADLVIELRTTSRALRQADGADTAELNQERDRLQRTLDEIATITGLPPSELGGAFASQ
jgi:hypothetical protein